jgi:hypothetical protein
MEAKHYARELKYPKGALVYNGTDEDDFLYCLLDNKEISVCREMAKNMGFPKLKNWPLRHVKGLPRRHPCIQQSEGTEVMDLKIDYLVLYSRADPIFLQGLILSNALRAQKNAEDENYQIALGNLRSEVI